MFNSPSPELRIAIYGSEVDQPGRNIGMWKSGYQGFITAAGATPVFLKPAIGDRSWGEILGDCIGVVACGFTRGPTKHGDLESLCLWARAHRFPLLAVDRGLLALNAALGGLNYDDLARELPDALQHRHPPEAGLRHAIVVQPKTLLAKVYGEGEIVVNSEHRQAVQRVASGFNVSGTALDGVIEAIEYKSDSWFALGVQWQPASSSASGLDIQAFRALIDAGKAAAVGTPARSRRLAVAV
ncbi:MAG: gamma-glutamyl-gamma-aminobutyrate hydrolase family protein [Gemmataceae bacterium]|nr:gamma-glutamyl-gamma-aminobutyrate hydrolase family protein [Gemmataceae bacterium]